VAEVIVVADEVGGALADGAGIVALETSVIGQGLAPPRSAECVRRMSRAIRDQGAVPAWIGAIDGRLVVGLEASQLDRFCEPGAATKVARRDLPTGLASGALGATTVSATIWAAAAAGIRVTATGGIGGVHLGDDPDVSADLLELARTPGLLVCSGPKSIVDPVATSERLEELGVAIVGYGTDRLPFFLVGAAAVELEHRADSPAEVAAMLEASLALGTSSTVVVANPVPAAFAMDAGEVAAAVEEAQRLADEEGALGKARTPFLLATLAELTQGRSLEANLALLEDNAGVAGQVAAALAART